MRLPQLDLTIVELPFVFNKGNLEIGIPESYLAEPINACIRDSENLVRDTESEKVYVDDLIFSFREGGFTVKGDVRVQFRKQLGKAPVIGTVYTPWITTSGTFTEELVVDIVDSKLTVSHFQLYLDSTDCQYNNIFNNFVLPYLQQEVIKRINDQLSNFNGMSLEEVVLKYGKTKLQTKIGSKFLGEERLNTLFKIADSNVNRNNGLQRIKNKFGSMGVNARVSRDHLWLSLVKRQAID